MSRIWLDDCESLPLDGAWITDVLGDGSSVWDPSYSSLASDHYVSPTHSWLGSSATTATGIVARGESATASSGSNTQRYVQYAVALNSALVDTDMGGMFFLPSFGVQVIGNPNDDSIWNYTDGSVFVYYDGSDWQFRPQGVDTPLSLDTWHEVICASSVSANSARDFRQDYYLDRTLVASFISSDIGYMPASGASWIWGDGNSPGMYIDSISFWDTFPDAMDLPPWTTSPGDPTGIHTYSQVFSY